jgi:hypothetical protein
MFEYNKGERKYQIYCLVHYLIIKHISDVPYNLSSSYP